MQKKIKVIFMGTPDFAALPLLSLLKNTEFEVQTVITQEDKKSGREGKISYPPVKSVAQKFNIPVLQPKILLKNHELTELLTDLKPDFIVVFAYGKILPAEILNIPKYGCINIHASLLPKYRGASPIEEALLNNESQTGISFINMIPELDAGPVYHIQRINIEPDDTSLSLKSKLSALSAELLPFVLKDIITIGMEPIPQDEKKATYCKKITKSNGKIDLSRDSATDIKNKIRAYTGWPGCFIDFNGKKLKIIDMEIDLKSDKALQAGPYDLIEIGKNKIGIGTRMGIIIPLKVQLEGKKEMDIQDFLAGNRKLLAKLLDSAK